MSKILVIAEKPSVGRDIAKVLKCTKKENGYLTSDSYIVSWAIGHLVTLSEPEDYNENLGRWTFNTLPIIPDTIKLKPIKNTKDQLNILYKLMNSEDVSSLICATDSGREGELIFRYIYEITKCNKPFKRLWISSMTDKAIKDGFNNLKDSIHYDDLYKSAKCRSESDWLVGINATRAYTIKYNSLLSIGRVQTPTLAIIVERQKEIDNFKPQDYYEIKAVFEKFSGKWFDKSNNNTKILEKNKADEIVTKCFNQTAKIINIEVEEKRIPQPLIYDLTALQRHCNEKFGFTAQRTLEIAQNLYEKRKLITYPRTDSNYLSDDMISKLPIILSKVEKIPQYKPYASFVLGLPKLPITKRIVDNSKVTDHHGIIPTDTNVNLTNITPDEFKVYDLIVKRFLAIFYPLYIYNITKIITFVLEEHFITKGNTIVNLGWMELYKKDDETKKIVKKKKDEDDDLEEELPEVKVDEQYEVTDINAILKKTKPPKAYTEAMLLSSMENAGRFVDDETLKEQLKSSGIGTPATRASIIERLLVVGYLERKGKILIATEKAKKLIEIAPKELTSPETTGKWEKGLTAISTGKLDTEKFMNSIFKYVYFLVDDAKQSQAKVIFPQEERTKNFNKSKSLGKCPICNEGDILENTKAFYCTNWRQGCKFSLWKSNLEQYSIILEANLVKEILKNKVIKNIKYKLPQTGEDVIGDLVLNNNMLELKNGSVGVKNK